MVEEEKSKGEDIKKLAQDNSENREEVKEVDNRDNRDELRSDEDRKKSDSPSEDNS